MLGVGAKCVKRHRYARISAVRVLKLPAADLPKFRRLLLAWFAKRKRDLPWRRTRDPYRIWLSEIMLQQTRVAAVIPYYERFLAAFPDVSALARAPADHVLAHWAGLGYYSRARNLQRAAQEIVARHKGEFPQNFQAALELPGIGQYTAAAVLSIAYGSPHAVLDGNVARVLARLGAVRGDLREPSTWSGLQSAAQHLLAERAAGDWNQAMMELGATVCTPNSPSCGECPVQKWCRARKLGIADELPEPRKKRATVDVTLAAAVLLDPQGRTLLIRHAGEPGALFSRMWQFPAVQATGSEDLGTLAAHLEQAFGLALNGNVERLPAARHSVTFRNISLVPHVIRVAALPQMEGLKATALRESKKLPISSATRKILARALAHCGPAAAQESRAKKRR